MTQRKIRPHRVSPLPVAQPATVLRAGNPAEQPLPGSLLAALITGAVCIQLIMWAFTPLTYLLDEIKISMFFIMGPLVMLLALTAIVIKHAPLPPRVIGWGLLAYGAVICLSTLLSDYHWIGRFYILFTWASAGFFMVTFVVAANRRGSYHLIRFMVILLLVEVMIGLFMYDMTSSVDHRSGVAFLKYMLYGTSEPRDSMFFSLLDTLVHADDQLQSTILNRDFFAGFCCMMVPFAYLLAFFPGPSRYPLAWRIVGVATSLLGTLTIFLCQSKGEWFTWIIASVFFCLMFFRIGYFKLRDLARGHLLAWLIGLVILMGAVAWMKSPTLFTQLKSTGSALESREIIWNGAWQIFKENPHNVIIGGGPGTFRIYFSSHRRPDYYLHGINNVTTLSHNYFLDILSETGLLGMLAFGLFLGGQFALGMRHALKKDNDLYLRLTLTAAMAGLASMYGSNMTSPSAKWVICATPMWAVMGLLSGLVYQGQKGPYVPGQAVEDPPAPWLPESLRNSWPYLREFGPLALLLLGVFMLGGGLLNGKNYFASMRQYAIGLNFLEGASGAYQQGGGDTATVIKAFEDSTGYFETSLKVDPSNTSSYYKLGSAYTSLAQIYGKMADDLAAKGKMQDAASALDISDDFLVKGKRAYETLMSYDPDYAEIHYNMGIIYQLYADMVKRRLQSGITGPEFTPEKVEHYNKLALDHLEKMREVSIKPEVVLLLGQQYLAMNRVDKARDVFRAASHRASADENMMLNYLATAMKINDYAGASDALEMLWMRRPAHEDWLDQLLQIARQNHYEDLIGRIVTRLEQINPVHPRLFEARIDLAQRQGKLEAVVDNIQEYMKVGGNNLEYLKLGADAAERLGRRDLAKQIYQKMVELDKDGKSPFGEAARKALGMAPAKAPAPAATKPATSTTAAAAKPGAAKAAATKAAAATPGAANAAASKTAVTSGASRQE